jgi:hypothetical protein
MKRAIALCGLVGLVGCFLPIAAGFSLFDARVFDALAVYAMMAAFAIPMLLGLADKLPTGGKVAAIGCFSYLLFYKMGFDVFDLIVHGSIGGKAMGVAAIGGFASSLGSFAESD